MCVTKINLLQTIFIHSLGFLLSFFRVHSLSRFLHISSVWNFDWLKHDKYKFRMLVVFESALNELFGVHSEKIVVRWFLNGETNIHWRSGCCSKLQRCYSRIIFTKEQYWGYDASYQCIKPLKNDVNKPVRLKSHITWMFNLHMTHFTFFVAT